MRKKNSDFRKKILVATAFDERLETVMRSVEQLCRVTGSTMRLVHVCDPLAKTLLPIVAENGSAELMDALKEEAMRIATRRLDALARTIDRSLRVETKVIFGDLAREIANDAEESGCGLIVVGASKGGGAGTIHGFSTAISLIMEASKPVMVLNELAIFEPRNNRPVVMACDDFSEVSSAALAFAFNISSAVDGAEMVHLHVEHYGDAHSNHAKLRDARSNGVITPERLHRHYREAEEKMLERAGAWPSQLERSGGRYTLEIVSGSVPDEIDRSAIAHRVDMMVLGQHKVFHRKSMHVGQVPYKAMLSQNRAVIVVPLHT